MKEFRLSKIKTENFRGVVGEREINLGLATSISGRERAGKTTMQLAVSWALFGKDPFGKSAPAGEMINDQQEHCIVELTGIFADGFEHVVTRKAKLQKSGNVAMQIFLDGEKTKQDNISRMFDLDLFFLIFNPLYIARLKQNSDVKTIKKLLSHYFGNVSNAESFKELQESNLEVASKLRDIIKTEDVKFNSSFINTKFKPTMLLMDKKEQLKSLKERQETNNIMITKLEDKEYSEIEVQDFDEAEFKVFEEDYFSKKNGFKSKFDVEIKRLTEEVGKLDIELQKYHNFIPAKQQEQSDIEKNIAVLDSTITGKNARITDARNQFKRVKNQIDSFKQEDESCPHCKAVIRTNIGEKTLLQENFKDLKKRGIELKADLDKDINQFNILTLKLDELVKENDAEIKSATKNLTKEKAILDEKKETLLRYEKEKIQEHNDFDSTLIKYEDDYQERKENYRIWKRDKEESSRIFKNKIEDKESVKRLRSENIILIQEEESIKDEIKIIETFNLTKLSMLAKEIESYFDKVKIEFFSLTKEGEIKDSFNMLFTDRSQEKHSTSESIETGFEIAKALIKKNKTSYPIFVDQAESFPSVVDILPESQVALISVVKNQDFKVDIIKE